ncbi:DUF5681 domain-containing protein [uncultured Sphingomonas sp.]|uniref:DUF5681 domain-containing protein n=1 Tax=uncultured Sphingomonas sp. TaxID=158754 RepID=UPI00258FBB91|nr:DUF5681 domain-containing protein [uncultured Sphingomonas sp.]
MPELLHSHDNTATNPVPMSRPDIVARIRTRRPTVALSTASNDVSPRRVVAVAQGPQPADAAAGGRAVDTYEVGYKKPPRETRFQKGRSGNPKGRPKGARGVDAVLKEIMNEKIAVKTAGGRQKMRRKVAMLHRAVDLALAGNTRMMELVLRRLDNAETREFAEVIRSDASTPSATAAVIPSRLPVTFDAHDEAILAELRHTLAAEQGAPS